MSVAIGIVLIRVLFGTAMAAHGAQKLFGSFGGYGLKGTGGFFEGLGFRPGVAFATVAGLSEFFGGLLVVLGLFTPLGAAAILAAMIVAAISVHLKNGFFGTSNGIEMPFLYGAAALGLLFTGGGSYSLDSEFGITFVNRLDVTIGLLVLSVIGAMGSLAMRRPVQAEHVSVT